MRHCLLISLLAGLLSLNSQAQMQVSALTGPGKPSVSNIDSFAVSLRKKAEEKVFNRIGRRFYRSLYRPQFLYPHYYKNVYYNAAPSEKNYRVYFKFEPLPKVSYEFELPVKNDGKTFLLPMSDFLPDCKAKPAECICAAEDEVLLKGNAMHSDLFKTAGHTKFGYDPKGGTFIWTYQKIERLSSTKGHTLTVVFDANDLKILNKQLDTNVWMGRCLGKGCMISTKNGPIAVENIQTGDSVYARDSSGKKKLYGVIATLKRPVIAPFSMMQWQSENHGFILCSPAHPDAYQQAMGVRKEELIPMGLSFPEYREDETYDILSDAPDGGYYCGELYLRSTLPFPEPKN